MIDKVRVYAKGGAGGQGSSKRGGTGGDGGEVIVRAEKCNLSDLARRESRRFIAQSGQNSSYRSVHGKKGNSLIIPVPPGTIIMDSSSRQQLYDLDALGSKVTLVKGGRGGCDHTPNWSGTKGEVITVNLVLKLIADVGMVGFPNAGKSTLLGAISNAAPKVADYPFTTVRPHLGYVNLHHSERMKQFTVADLPGLVEGAHNNVGMGHRFLRHIERTKVLLFVVDIGGFRLSNKTSYRNAHEAIQLLTQELELYQSGLSSRSCVLAVNKMDISGADKMLSTLMDCVLNSKEGPIPQFLHIVPISAEKRLHIEELKSALSEALDHAHLQDQLKESSAINHSRKLDPNLKCADTL